MRWKAAELHGAAHQAVMEFQVVLDRQWKPIRAGRSKISFCCRKDMAAVEAGVERRNVDAGTMRVSMRELTALDLLRYPKTRAGLDHAATILQELGSELDPERLASLSVAFERSVTQRLGYILIGPVLDDLRGVLEPWLGKGGYDGSPVAPKLRFRVPAEDDPDTLIRLKIEKI